MSTFALLDEANCLGLWCSGDGKGRKFRSPFAKNDQFWWMLTLFQRWLQPRVMSASFSWPINIHTKTLADSGELILVTNFNRGIHYRTGGTVGQHALPIIRCPYFDPQQSNAKGSTQVWPVFNRFGKIHSNVSANNLLRAQAIFFPP